MLKNLKALYDDGWAIHLLKPKSKAPINAGWTTRAKQTWESLCLQYKPGMNFGVRLGKISRIGDGYLAVIDCDYRSGDINEMHRALQAAFPNLVARRVLSGRANGSLHYYVLTKQPIKEVRIAAKKGEWSIVLMSEGRQVVLPPSVHPDTGKRYYWEDAVSPLQLIDVPEAQEPVRAEVKDRAPFVPVSYDLSRLSPTMIGAITAGIEKGQRSELIYRVASTMVRVGYSDNEILSVLTDPNNGISEAAKDRRGADLSSQVSWLREYTLTRVREENDPVVAFAAFPIEQNIKIEQKPEEANRKSQPLLHMMELISSVKSPLVRHDKFSGQDTYVVNTPWRAKKGERVTDKDANRIREWCSVNFKYEPKKDLVFDAVSNLADKCSFHPVQDYLNSLVWDGESRINTWMKDYLNAEDSGEALILISRRFLMGMVARVMQPGIKFDTMLILEGKQGIGKSSVGRILASEAWFSDTLPNIHDKDARLNLCGTWINEVPELANLKHSDVESYKSFFSAQTDRVRRPYGRNWEDFPRQTVFIGTTNAMSYLKDKTGNRRFWIVKIGEVQFAKLEKDKSQLLAEAFFLWKTKADRIYFNMEEQKLLDVITEKRQVFDDSNTIEEAIVKFMEKEEKEKEKNFEYKGFFDQKRFLLSDLFNSYAPLERWNCRGYHGQIATEVLFRLGFKRIHSHGCAYWKQGDATNPTQ